MLVLALVGRRKRSVINVVKHYFVPGMGCMRIEYTAGIIPAMSLRWNQPSMQTTNGRALSPIRAAVITVISEKVNSDRH